jgi:hypothetical protein
LELFSPCRSELYFHDAFRRFLLNASGKGTTTGIRGISPPSLGFRTLANRNNPFETSLNQRTFAM